ncbi:33643_t:CDS:10 [Gigaspora margarita]|uniref:33643_t:CDS:1 n=1 Tax=Gigaspora margarita TaxID=4874 RepID=A0ABM8VXK7_GIGMA|nr:33643_t:CDS:10 [Gigaspora margarita]
MKPVKTIKQAREAIAELLEETENGTWESEREKQVRQENDFDGTPYLLEKLLEVKDFEAPPAISEKEEEALIVKTYYFGLVCKLTGEGKLLRIWFNFVKILINQGKVAIVYYAGKLSLAEVVDGYETQDDQDKSKKRVTVEFEKDPGKDELDKQEGVVKGILDFQGKPWGGGEYILQFDGEIRNVTNDLNYNQFRALVEHGENKKLTDLYLSGKDLEGDLKLPFEEFPKLERVWYADKLRIITKFDLDMAVLLKEKMPKGISLEVENRVQILKYTPIEEVMEKLYPNEEENKEITELDLTQKGLRGTLDLEGFEKKNVNSNYITGLNLPRSLKILTLTNNPIEREVGTLIGLENLTKLDISYNPNIKLGLENFENLEEAKVKGTNYEKSLKSFNVIVYPEKVSEDKPEIIQKINELLTYSHESEIEACIKCEEDFCDNCLNTDEFEGNINRIKKLKEEKRRLENKANFLLNKELSPEKINQELNNLKPLFNSADLPNTYTLLEEVCQQLLREARIKKEQAEKLAREKAEKERLEAERLAKEKAEQEKPKSILNEIYEFARPKGFFSKQITLNQVKEFVQKYPDPLAGINLKGRDKDYLYSLAKDHNARNQVREAKGDFAKFKD